MDVPILNTQTRKTKIRKFGIIIDLGKNPGPQHLAEIFFLKSQNVEIRSHFYSEFQPRYLKNEFETIF